MISYRHKLALIGVTLLSLVALAPAYAIDFTFGLSGESGFVCYDSATGEVIVGINTQSSCTGAGRRWGAGILPQYTGPGRTNAPIRDVNGFLALLVGVIKFFQVVFWVLTVGFGLYAAYLYLFSNGNKEATTKARKVLIYTVVAAVVSVLAYSIPSVIDKYLAG